jgi:hypothetical protein
MAQAALSAASSFSPTKTAAGVAYCVDAACTFLVMTTFVAGSDPPEPVLSGILHALQSLREEQKSFHSSVDLRLRIIENAMGSRQSSSPCQSLAGEAPSISQSRSRSCSRRRSQPVLGLPWICPICNENLSHRDSFKGHIRLCFMLQHQRCRLMEDNVEHQALLRRFPNGAWDDRAAAFILEFYEQIRGCSSSLDPDHKSHAHIFGWLNAATSLDSAVPFPSYSSAVKRRRKGTGTQSVGIVGSAPISSNGSSPDLLSR